MSTSRPDPRLRDLLDADLGRLHREGTCPSPARLRGVADGLVLTSRPVRWSRVWRGKFFESSSDFEATGRNRVGWGPVERRAYRFVARVATSRFADREVVRLDHDLPGNPAWVRRFHDELVQVDDGLFLASSDCRVGSGLRRLAWFALSLESSAAG